MIQDLSALSMFVCTVVYGPIIPWLVNHVLHFSDLPMIFGLVVTFDFWVMWRLGMRGWLRLTSSSLAMNFASTLILFTAAIHLPSRDKFLYFHDDLIHFVHSSDGSEPFERLAEPSHGWVLHSEGFVFTLVSLTLLCIFSVVIEGMTLTCLELIWQRISGRKPSGKAWEASLTSNVLSYVFIILPLMFITWFIRDRAAFYRGDL